MKARPFKRTQVPDLTKLNASSEIKRKQVVAVIASLLPPKEFADARDARNSVSANLNYDEFRRKDTSRRLCRNAAKRYRVGAVVTYITRRYPAIAEKFASCPGNIVGAAVLPAIRTSGTGHWSPKTLAEAEAIIKELAERVRGLDAACKKPNLSKKNKK